MKILAIENSIFNVKNGEEPQFAFYPDSSILRNNDDFYIPNFSKSVYTSLGIYIKFTKIGKCIEPQFAHRYFNQFGAAINFTANNGETDIERGFDKSLATSNTLLDISFIKEPISFLIDSQEYSFSLEELEQSIYKVIASISEYFTIKIGDILYLPLHKTETVVRLSSSYSVSIKQENLLSFSAK